MRHAHYQRRKRTLETEIFAKGIFIGFCLSLFVLGIAIFAGGLK